MLKQRLLTAAVLIPLVVLAILALPTQIFQFLILAIVLLAAWEWFAVIGLSTVAERLMAYLVLISAILSASILLQTELTALAIGFWALISLFVAAFAFKPLSQTLQLLLQQKLFGTLLAVFVLVLFQLSAVQLHALDNGAEYLLFVMIAVWLADTGGYFAGKRWGKHKLAPYISPNKTWQGVYGAVALVSVWAAISFYSFFAINASFMEWLALMMVAAVISIVGDLFESVFKRLHDVKDSGNLLPGHGGVLDRIDSLLAAVPVFFAGLSLVGMR